MTRNGNNLSFHVYFYTYILIIYTDEDKNTKENYTLALNRYGTSAAGKSRQVGRKQLYSISMVAESGIAYVTGYRRSTTVKGMSAQVLSSLVHLAGNIAENTLGMQNFFRGMRVKFKAN